MEKRGLEVVVVVVVAAVVAAEMRGLEDGGAGCSIGRFFFGDGTALFGDGMVLFGDNTAFVGDDTATSSLNNNANFSLLISSLAARFNSPSSTHSIRLSASCTAVPAAASI